jgi:arginine-tRNA-protein transferase
VVERPADECSESYGILVSHMPPSLYLQLVELGWRRSGLHIYKPHVWNTCCPALTIRLPVDKFVPSKSQERVWKTMHKVLQLQPKNNSEPKPKHTKSPHASSSLLQSPLVQQATTRLQQALTAVVKDHKYQRTILKLRFKPWQGKGQGSTVYTTVCAAVAGTSQGNWDRRALAHQVVQRLQSLNNVTWEATEQGHVLCHLPHEDNLVMTDPQDHKQEDGTITPATTQPTRNKDWVHTWLQSKTPPHEVAITNMSALQASLLPQVHQLYFEYQQQVHGDPNPLTANENEVDWGEASSDYIEQATAMLAQTYSETDLPAMLTSFASFYRFLVESPLDTYHQLYYVHDKLLAVGVVDVVPNQGLSSVYAFYDPHWSKTLCPLGKYVTLHEIDYAKQHNLPYYYLGYYIHSCPKMKYKADYRPSELLCPVTYTWVPAEPAQALLERSVRHVCRLATTAKNNDDKEKNHNDDVPDVGTSFDCHHMALDVGVQQVVTLDMLRPNGQDIVRQLVEEFLQQAGPAVAQQCLLKLV